MFHPVSGFPGETQKRLLDVVLDFTFRVVDDHSIRVFMSLHNSMNCLGKVDICHGRFQIVHVVENFRILTNSSLLHDLDERIDHENKEQWREGIALDDAVCEADLAHVLFSSQMRGGSSSLTSR